MNAEKSPAGAGNAAPGHAVGNSNASIQPQPAAGKPPTKICRVLRCLVEGPCTSFELERQAHDHCPNSTVSDLKRMGLRIESELVEAPGFAGAVARIARYTLAPESRAKAQQILEARR